MQRNNLIRAGLLAISLSFIVIICWEIHLRGTGMPISYDDNEALWADKRGMVYEPQNKSTVFIGSSRIKYDLDIPTWEALTGDHAIQLANVGSNPRFVLTDLANDKNFAGKLVIDVTELLFFSDFSPNDALTIKKISYYHHITPTQKASFQINHVLESQFLFLDQETYSYNALLDAIPLPPRAGVFSMPLFPVEFHATHFDRQTAMTPKFVADTNLQNQVKAIWIFLGSLPGRAPASGDKLKGIFNAVKADIDKIKSRGGQVILVRTPSSGGFRQAEIHGFPRTVYWDGLLKATGCPGIYFEDYPATAKMICPEWSHLSPDDAVVYTKSLIGAIQEKGWSFPDKPAAR
jgi:hypothetical protein